MWPGIHFFLCMYMCMCGIFFIFRIEGRENYPRYYPLLKILVRFWFPNFLFWRCWCIFHPESDEIDVLVFWNYRLPVSKIHIVLCAISVSSNIRVFISYFENHMHVSNSIPKVLFLIHTGLSKYLKFLYFQRRFLRNYLFLIKYLQH